MTNFSGRPAQPTSKPAIHTTDLSWAIVLALTTACLVIAAAVFHGTGGHLVYSLDDPYIHLALAKSIAQGHYGINAGEHSAPSSSVLWPFLLAPFATLRAFELIPFWINVLCLLSTGVVIHRFFARLVGEGPATWLALSFVFASNLLGLVFTGMEHSLQVLAVSLVASRVAGLPVSNMVFYACAVLLPAIRYEDLAISLPVLTWLAVRERSRSAWVAIAAMLFILGGFSIFLASLGLHPLPSSVLAKTELGPGNGLVASGRSLVQGLFGNVEAMTLLSFGLALVAIFTELRRRENWTVALLLVPAVLVYLFGKNGWYGRYEVHFLVYGGLLICHLLLRGSIAAAVARRSPWVGLLFVGVNLPLVWCTVTTPKAAQNIFEQQWQMAEIARRLDAPVAVNDLGLVSLRSSRYVLDLAGLGSQEALRLGREDSSGSWIGPLLQKHQVHYAFVYDKGSPQRPNGWIRVGSLHLLGSRITPYSETVSLYATDPKSADTLREVLQTYRASSEWVARVAKIEN